MNTTKEKGITIIALVVTIIILLILAGITINLILGQNGLLNSALQAKNKNSEASAKEKLALVLFDMQADKESNLEYNQEEYLTQKLEEKGMKVEGNFVIVDEWEFEIDRSIPQIISDGIKPEKISGNEGLLGIVAQISESKYYEVALKTNVEGETIKENNYSLHVIEHEGDLILDGIQEVEGATLTSKVYEFGSKTNDVATATDNAKNMIVLKVDGNLTIEEGITLTACKSDDGYGGPKGMLIYCNGTLTNNGTISMTARGAKAEGEDVYLWKNSDGSYEYVPKVGASGGSGGLGYGRWDARGGATPNAALNRQTGGGGGGAGFQEGWRGGTGSAGTSYSGGTGGGGAAGLNGENGSTNGGKGGNGCSYLLGSISVSGAGGGAGNPGGTYQLSGNVGSNGTGGLLIIYGKHIINNGTISSNGSAGGNSYRAAGAGSGGGSINIFYKTIKTNGTITANGGAGGAGTRGTQCANGGAGGKGSVTIGHIQDGNFVKE